MATTPEYPRYTDQPLSDSGRRYFAVKTAHLEEDTEVTLVANALAYVVGIIYLPDEQAVFLHVAPEKPDHIVVYRPVALEIAVSIAQQSVAHWAKIDVQKVADTKPKNHLKTMGYSVYEDSEGNRFYPLTAANLELVNALQDRKCFDMATIKECLAYFDVPEDDIPDQIVIKIRPEDTNLHEGEGLVTYSVDSSEINPN